jgi:5'-phosphate synthase pdxT subunit
MTKLIGVLALQGGYAAHRRALADCSLESIEVRRPGDLDHITGLVLPGGESTTQLKLLHRFELWSPIATFVAGGAPVLATCAGMILAAKTVHEPTQESFGWIDIDVERNGWGRQIHSGEALADISNDGNALGNAPLPLLFIRAPRIKRIGPSTHVLATLSGEPVLVREGSVTAASFHPELTLDRRIHSQVFSH